MIFLCLFHSELFGFHFINFLLIYSGALTIDASAIIKLTGGVTASSIYWAVSGATTIAASAVFQGILLGSTDVTLAAGATFTGKFNFTSTEIVQILNLCYFFFKGLILTQGGASLAASTVIAAPSNCQNPVTYACSNTCGTTCPSSLNSKRITLFQ